MPRLFSFSLLIASFAVGAHLYLYLRLVHATTRSRALRLLGAGAFAGMTWVLASRKAVLRAVPEGWADEASFAMYLWMGVALFVVLALACVEAGRLVALIRQKLAPKALLPQPAVDEERRRFLARTLGAGATVGGGAVAGYGVYRAFAAPDINEVPVRLARLPRALDGFTIVQLTDIHVGPAIGRRFVDALVRETNALKPDLIAITGDLVDGNVATLGPAVAGLGALQSRLGTFFVTGNHDYYSGDAAWVAFLRGLGMTVLRNERAVIGDGAASFDLVGVDDWSGARRRGLKGYDLEAAIAGRDPDRAAVLLAHQPANFEVAATRGVDLQISGHTHGGQIFPMTHLIGLGWDYTAGLYQRGDSQIFVSRGCGFWGPPMRVGSPPEIVKLVLTV